MTDNSQEEYERILLMRAASALKQDEVVLRNMAYLYRHNPVAKDAIDEMISANDFLIQIITMATQNEYRKSA